MEYPNIVFIILTAAITVWRAHLTLTHVLPKHQGASFKKNYLIGLYQGLGLVSAELPVPSPVALGCGPRVLRAFSCQGMQFQKTVKTPMVMGDIQSLPLLPEALSRV